MADIQETQTDLFPEIPAIHGLGIVKFETKGAEVVATLNGVTNVNDIARLNDECWRLAVAEWLIRLCRDDPAEAKRHVMDAWAALQAAEDEEQQQAA